MLNTMYYQSILNSVNSAPIYTKHIVLSTSKLYGTKYDICGVITWNINEKRVTSGLCMLNISV